MTSIPHRAAKHAALPLAACAAAALIALATLPAPALAQQAQRVAIDPETGRIRAPELDELSNAPAAARAAAIAPNAARAAAPSAERAAPVNGVRFGAKGFRVDPNRMSFTVVKRNADGSLSTQCVTGEDAAEHALHGKLVGGDQ